MLTKVIDEFLVRDSDNIIYKILVYQEFIDTSDSVEPDDMLPGSTFLKTDSGKTVTTINKDNGEYEILNAGNDSPLKVFKI